ASVEKDATRPMPRPAGIGSAPGSVLRGVLWAREGRGVQAHLGESLPRRWFVKPARAGSSLGVTRVNDPAELDLALKNAFAEDPKVLIEEAVVGREIECGLLQGIDGCECLSTVPGEVKVGDDLEVYDYEAKYFGKGTVSIDVPADLPDAQLEAVGEVAARAFEVLGLEG